MIINLVNRLFFTGKTNVVYRFNEAILKEYDYCKEIIKRHFDKNRVTSATNEEGFRLSNNCWICDKLFDVQNDKVRDHFHITGKCRSSAYWGCNINFRVTKKVPIIFHNLRGYGSYLIIQEIGESDVKVNVIPNGLEKYMAFTINRNLIFIDSIQFKNSSLNALANNLSDNDFKYLSKEFSDEVLRLVKQKGMYPYEYIDSFEKFSENKIPDIYLYI